MMKKMTGIFPALVTPYDSQGKLDTDRVQALVERLRGEGVRFLPMANRIF